MAETNNNLNVKLTQSSDDTPNIVEDLIAHEVELPKNFKIVQGVCLGIIALVLLLLVTFIIYISATWNKYRGNEYS
jgi:hypothetical protein